MSDHKCNDANKMCNNKKVLIIFRKINCDRFWLLYNKSATIKDIINLHFSN